MLQETFHLERKKLHCCNESVGSKNLVEWFFFICYHAGGSTKHLPPPKVTRPNEESSPSDALTPKKRGKIRTCLWACPLTPPPPQPHLSAPCLCKIKMCGSRKMAWIFAIRTTRYPLILMLYCNIFIFVVKQGVPSDEDLEWPYPSCLLYTKDTFFKLFARL